MRSVLSLLASSLSDSDVIVVSGDHGMTRQGGHGGGSPDELSTLQLFLRPGQGTVVPLFFFLSSIRRHGHSGRAHGSPPSSRLSGPASSPRPDSALWRLCSWSRPSLWPPSSRVGRARRSLARLVEHGGRAESNGQGQAAVHAGGTGGHGGGADQFGARLAEISFQAQLGRSLSRRHVCCRGPVGPSGRLVRRLLRGALFSHWGNEEVSSFSLEWVLGGLALGWNFGSSFAEESHLAFHFLAQTLALWHGEWPSVLALRLGKLLVAGGDKWRSLSPLCQSFPLPVWCSGIWSLSLCLFVSSPLLSLPALLVALHSWSPSPLLAWTLSLCLSSSLSLSSLSMWPRLSLSRPPAPPSGQRLLLCLLCFSLFLCLSSVWPSLLLASSSDWTSLFRLHGHFSLSRLGSSQRRLHFGRIGIQFSGGGSDGSGERDGLSSDCSLVLQR